MTTPPTISNRPLRVAHTTGVCIMCGFPLPLMRPQDQLVCSGCMPRSRGSKPGLLSRLLNWMLEK